MWGSRWNDPGRRQTPAMINCQRIAIYLTMIHSLTHVLPLITNTNFIKTFATITAQQRFLSSMYQQVYSLLNYFNAMKLNHTCCIILNLLNVTKNLYEWWYQDSCVVISSSNIGKQKHSCKRGRGWGELIIESYHYNHRRLWIKLGKV